MDCGEDRGLPLNNIHMMMKREMMTCMTVEVSRLVMLYGEISGEAACTDRRILPRCVAGLSINIKSSRDQEYFFTKSTYNTCKLCLGEGRESEFLCPKPLIKLPLLLLPSIFPYAFRESVLSIIDFNLPYCMKIKVSGN